MDKNQEQNIILGIQDNQDRHGIDYGILYNIFSKNGNLVLVEEILEYLQDIMASTIFSELVLKNVYYLDTFKTDKEGYFFYTINDMQKRFKIGRTAQNRVFELLEEKGLIQRKNTVNSPNKAGRYFKVNFNHHILEELKAEYIMEYDEMETQIDIFGSQLKENQQERAKKLNRKSQDVKNITKEVIAFLNQESNRNFQIDSPYNIQLIENLLKQGYKKNQILAVTQDRVYEWENSSKMSKYIRPSTIYGNGKFEKYLNECDKEILNSIKFIYLDYMEDKDKRIQEIFNMLELGYDISSIKYKYQEEYFEAIRRREEKYGVEWF